MGRFGNYEHVKRKTARDYQSGMDEIKPNVEIESHKDACYKTILKLCIYSLILYAIFWVATLPASKWHNERHHNTGNH